MTKLEMLYVDAGGGHRAAAAALKSAIEEQGWGWQIRLVNLFEILDPKDSFRRATGVKPEHYYNARLAHGWTLGLAQELRLLQAVIRLSHGLLVKRLRRFWSRSQPDLVVSLIPNFGRCMFEALSVARPGVPFVTILTDLADYPPHFWIEPKQAQWWICGSPHAAAQARNAGCDPRRVHLVSGMIIRPDFYRPARTDRESAMRELGLDAQRPTGIVAFGGHGSKVMLGIARRLSETQLILMCGHNAALAERLRKQPAKAPRVVVGFTSRMQDYMRLADFFIGKPGPGSISEALQQGVPPIVVHNTWTMPQERYNTRWLQERRAGVVLESFKSIAEGVAEVTANLADYRAAVRRIDNRAVFEIPPLLNTILQRRALESSVEATRLSSSSASA